MRLTAKATLLALTLAIAGCNGPRALPVVKDAGDLAFQKGDMRTANANYQEYVQRKPGEPEVQLSYAKTLLALGQPTSAVENAHIAFDQRPGDEEAIETLARGYYESHRTDELYRFLRGLAESRGKPSDYIRLGQYSAKLGDADGAEHALLLAAQVDKGRTPAPQLALADFYRSIGAKDRAITRLRMALYTDRNNPEIPKQLRELGEIPGPSLALKPTEAP